MPRTEPPLRRLTVRGPVTPDPRAALRLCALRVRPPTRPVATAGLATRPPAGARTGQDHAGGSPPAGYSRARAVPHPDLARRRLTRRRRPAPAAPAAHRAPRALPSRARGAEVPEVLRRPWGRGCAGGCRARRGARQAAPSTRDRSAAQQVIVVQKNVPAARRTGRVSPSSGVASRGLKKPEAPAQQRHDERRVDAREHLERLSGAVGAAPGCSSAHFAVSATKARASYHGAPRRPRAAASAPSPPCRSAPASTRRPPRPRVRHRCGSCR